MSNPYQFKEHQLVNIGALYSAKLDETLSALALRFRADIRSLLVVCSAALGHACGWHSLQCADIVIHVKPELMDFCP